MLTKARPLMWSIAAVTSRTRAPPSSYSTTNTAREKGRGSSVAGPVRSADPSWRVRRGLASDNLLILVVAIILRRPSRIWGHAFVQISRNSEYTSQVCITMWTEASRRHGEKFGTS